MSDRFTAGRSYTTGLVVALATFAGVLPLAGQSWRTQSSARQINGEEALDVQVEYGAGHLSVGGAEGSLLYRMRMRYDEEQVTPTARYDRERGILYLGVDSREDERGFSRDASDQSRAIVELAPGVPIDLDLEFGAGAAELALGGLSIRELEISTGASETRVTWDTPNRIPAEQVRMEAGAASLHASGLGNARAARYEFNGGVGETVLDFGGEWTRSARAEIDMGLGELTLRFPRDLGIRIEKDGFLVDFDGAGLVRRGDVYYSRNWDQAAHKLALDVDAAFSEINIEWIP